MKVLIIFAAALLVPIVMKFQARAILNESNPETALQVGSVLTESNVIDPYFSMFYLEATIGGLVISESKLDAIISEIHQIRGVSSINNELVLRGWMNFTRKSGQLKASGIVPASWKGELLKEQSEAMAEELQGRDSVILAGKSAVAWGVFIDRFFGGKGDRELNLLGSRLSLIGEATPSELRTLQAKTASLGRAIVVESKMRLQPSHYHFESRILNSPIEGEPLRALSQKLVDKNLAFQARSKLLSPAAKEAANELSSLIAEVDSEVTFVLGGHPDTPDAFGAELASQRAQAVKAMLVENGIASERLEVVSFDKMEDGAGFSGQVELLVR